jgi:hypothetical protein
MRDKIFVGVLASMWILAIGLILVCVYIRCFIVSDDPFDPLRETSVECLFASCFVFLSSAAFAKVVSLIVR